MTTTQRRTLLAVALAGIALALHAAWQGDWGWVVALAGIATLASLMIIRGDRWGGEGWDQ